MARRHARGITRVRSTNLHEKRCISFSIQLEPEIRVGKPCLHNHRTLLRAYRDKDGQRRPSLRFLCALLALPLGLLFVAIQKDDLIVRLVTVTVGVRRAYSRPGGGFRGDSNVLKHIVVTVAAAHTALFIVASDRLAIESL